MRNQVLLLEQLRRTYDVSCQRVQSVTEAIERGWIASAKDYTSQIHDDTTAAGQSGEQLSTLLREHASSKDLVISQWVAIHLKACARLLEADIQAGNPEASIRAICIAQLAAGAAQQLQPSRRHFSVNSQYIKDYVNFFDQCFEECFPRCTERSEDK